jgi:hypothetical protein
MHDGHLFGQDRALTLNQMTARVLLPGGRFEVSGEGYRPQGSIRAARDGSRLPELTPLLIPLVAHKLMATFHRQDDQVTCSSKVRPMCCSRCEAAGKMNQRIIVTVLCALLACGG